MSKILKLILGFVVISMFVVSCSMCYAVDLNLADDSMDNLDLTTNTNATNNTNTADNTNNTNTTNNTNQTSNNTDNTTSNTSTNNTSNTNTTANPSTTVSNVGSAQESRIDFINDFNHFINCSWYFTRVTCDCYFNPIKKIKIMF